MDETRPVATTATGNNNSNPVTESTTAATPEISDAVSTLQAAIATALSVRTAEPPTAAATASGDSTAATKPVTPAVTGAAPSPHPAVASSIRAAEQNVLEFDDKSHLYTDHLGIASDPHLKVFFASLRRDDQTTDEKLLFSDTAQMLPVNDLMLAEAKNPAKLIAAASAGASGGGMSVVPTSAALKASARANEPESVSFVVSNFAVYSFPPQIIVPAAPGKDGKTDPNAPPTKFMVYNNYKRYALSDIMLCSLPYRSSDGDESGGGGGDFALRTNDFVLHLAGANRAHAWFQTRPGARSQVVEVFCDAYKSLLSREVELQNPDFIELLTSLLDGSIDQFVRDIRLEYWASASASVPPPPGGGSSQSHSPILKCGWLMIHYASKPEPIAKLTATTVTVVGSNTSPVKTPNASNTAGGTTSSPPPQPKPKYEWKRRWCVLSRNSYLFHFSDSAEYEAFRIIAAQKFGAGSPAKQRSIAPFLSGSRAIGPIDLCSVVLTKQAIDNPQTIHVTELMPDGTNCIRYVFRIPREAELPATTAPAAPNTSTGGGTPPIAIPSGGGSASVSAGTASNKRPSVTTLSFAAFFASEASPPAASAVPPPSDSHAISSARPPTAASVNKKRAMSTVGGDSKHAHVASEKRPSKERQFEQWYAALFHCLFPFSAANQLAAVVFVPPAVTTTRAAAASVSSGSGSGGSGSGRPPIAGVPRQLSHPVESTTNSKSSQPAMNPPSGTATPTEAAGAGPGGSAPASPRQNSRVHTHQQAKTGGAAVSGVSRTRTPSPASATAPPIPPKTKPVPTQHHTLIAPHPQPSPQPSPNPSPAPSPALTNRPLIPPRPAGLKAAPTATGTSTGSTAGSTASGAGGISITNIKVSDSVSDGSTGGGAKFSFKSSGSSPKNAAGGGGTTSTSPPVTSSPSASGGGGPAKSRASSAAAAPTTPKATTPSGAANAPNPFAAAVTAPPPTSAAAMYAAIANGSLPALPPLPPSMPLLPSTTTTTTTTTTAAAAGAPPPLPLSAPPVVLVPTNH